MRLATVLLLISGLAATIWTGAAAQAPVPAAGSTYTFRSGAGILFFYVKPEKLAEFEAVVGRIRQVLDTTTDPVRRQQADSWRIFKSVEAQSGPVYVFMFDPAIASADYDPIKLLGEAAPIEIQGLYTQLKDAIVKVERMGLSKVR